MTTTLSAGDSSTRRRSNGVQLSGASLIRSTSRLESHWQPTSCWSAPIRQAIWWSLCQVHTDWRPFAGSAAQSSLLRGFDWHQLEDTCVLFVHALNPWGAANKRRQNEDNVDVNRNFRRDVRTSVENQYFEILHPLIHRPDVFVRGERNPEVEQSLRDFRAEYGDAAFHTALFKGQTLHADGIGYCGLARSWSNKNNARICAEYGPRRDRVAVVDIHTGLGEFGLGSLLFTQSEVALGDARGKALVRK